MASTRREWAAAAFILGGVILAFVIDGGRISLAVGLAGALIGTYVKHGDAKRAPKGPDQASEARFMVGFAFLFAGAIVAVALYPGWEPVAVVMLFAVLGMVVMRLGVGRRAQSSPPD